VWTTAQGDDKERASETTKDDDEEGRREGEGRAGQAKNARDCWHKKTHTKHKNIYIYFFLTTHLGDLRAQRARAVAHLFEQVLGGLGLGLRRLALVLDALLERLRVLHAANERREVGAQSGRDRLFRGATRACTLNVLKNK
jgi:hypothetical protein